MKIPILTIITALSLMSSNTHADYQCSGEDMSLYVNENHTTHAGNTSITLSSEHRQEYLFGNIHVEDSVFFKKKTVEIHPFQGDTLTIVSMLKKCGRGSCDSEEGYNISAHLKTQNQETFFSCEEI